VVSQYREIMCKEFCFGKSKPEDEDRSLPRIIVLKVYSDLMYTMQKSIKLMNSVKLDLVIHRILFHRTPPTYHSFEMNFRFSFIEMITH